MRVLRKLIVTEWIRFWFASLISLFLLLSTGNLVNGFMRTNVETFEILMNYFIQTPSFLIQVLPVSCLIASLFSINKLKNRNELTAIFASGFSRQSFIGTLINISLGVCLLQFLISAFINPYMSSKKTDLLAGSLSKFRNLKSKGLTSTISSGEIWYKSGNYYFSFSHFNNDDKSINNVKIYTYDVEYKLKSLSFISRLAYNENESTWSAQDQTLITNLNMKSFPSFETLSTPISLNEKLSDFEKIESDITTLSFFSLYDYIVQLEKSGINSNEYYVVFLRHISDSLICIIFSLLAAIPIFNPNRRNSSFGKSASFVFIFTIIYWLVQTYFLELGMNLKLHPLIACFTIPLLFSSFIFIVFYKNRNLA